MPDTHHSIHFSFSLVLPDFPHTFSLLSHAVSSLSFSKKTYMHKHKSLISFQNTDIDIHTKVSVSVNFSHELLQRTKEEGEMKEIYFHLYALRNKMVLRMQSNGFLYFNIIEMQFSIHPVLLWHSKWSTAIHLLATHTYTQ